MNLRLLSVVFLSVTVGSLDALASFHSMQIEQIIGGIQGDSSAQAIQLRMRSGGQNQVAPTRLRAFDAAGLNPLVLFDFGNSVSNSSGGTNILLTTAAFNAKMSSVPAFATDFTLTNAIPASYLSGGKVTFEQDNGSILWSVAFGNYTGTNTGTSDNDPDSNFGAPFPGALPIASAKGIRFTGLFSEPSTTNAEDYGFTADPATVRNNAGNSFTVVPEPTAGSLLAVFGLLGLGICRRAH